NPLYGGTDHFINEFLPKLKIDTIGFDPDESIAEVKNKIKASGKADKLALVFIETPANPTNHLVDIESYKNLAKEFSSANHEVIVAVDNTYMGPIWQHPLKLGADLVLYSATKYIGGHSDVIAGAVLGNSELMLRVKTLRTFLGNMAGPWTGWLLMRSLETLKVRMEQQQSNAVKIADYLENHPKIVETKYLGLLTEGCEQYEVFKKQYSGTGAMVSFSIKGGEAEAFKLLNSLKLIKLAVSLGGTESLVEHPKTMTHASVNEEHLTKLGVTDSLVRLSVGVENYKDIIWDLEQALEKV
ncbi:MAG: PLP-dependent aspartate aminotransferase family protein, partial [Bacteroidia bacterium]|nr:PLP-dependent aspartate aminotransferase family protein [Bacteroidia bacterium]